MDETRGIRGILLAVEMSKYGGLVARGVSEGDAAPGTPFPRLRFGLPTETRREKLRADEHVWTKLEIFEEFCSRLR